MPIQFPRPAAFLLLALTVALSLPARAADSVFDARLGDEADRSLAATDTHTYRLQLTEGATLRLRMEAREGEDSDGGDASGEGPEKGGSGPAPEVVVLDPGGAELLREAAFDVESSVRAVSSGLYLVVLDAQGFVGDYELRLEGTAPRLVTGDVTVTGGAVGTLLAAPAGSSVRIDVRRLSGGPPDVVAVRDGTGRELGFTVRRTRSDRVSLHPVPVPPPGGLEVVVAARDGGAGSYRVRGRPVDDDDLAPEGEDDDHAPRRIVLFLEPGTDPQVVADALGYDLIRVEDGFVVVETPEDHEGLEHEDARDARDRIPAVLGAEPDQRASIPEGSQLNGVVRGSQLGRQDFLGQPALGDVSAGLAHDRATGQGIVVAVVDTGIDPTHPALAGNLLPGFDFVDGDADPTDVADLVDADLDGITDEGFGHGTFVSGLVLGAAPGASILPVRVLDSEGRGDASTVAAGIEFAVREGADVINLSLGSRARSDVLQGAVRYALSHGVTVVAATGNSGSTTAVDFPGGVRGVVAVTAVDGNGALPAFANRGPRTALAAPGVSLVGPFPGGEYAEWTGTSFSAALASGGAALVRQQRPGLRPAQVARRMRLRARGFGRAVPRRQRRLAGSGRLDLARLAR